MKGETKMNTNFFKNVSSTLMKHSPEILTGLGIAGMVTSTVLAVKATPKAIQLLEERKEEINKKAFDENIDRDYSLKDHKEIDKLGAKETIKTVWKCYIPSAVMAGASIACLIGASSVHVKRNAVLATAYQLSEAAATEYRNKVVETIGAKKEESIRDAVNKDRIEQNPVTKNEIFLTEKGNTLCYDHLSGRYFKSDIDKIKKSINELNHQINKTFYVSLNDLYDELGLDRTELGEVLGWNSDMGLLELHFSSHLAADGVPCLALDFNHLPKYDFDKFV